MGVKILIVFFYLLRTSRGSTFFFNSIVAMSIGSRSGVTSTIGLAPMESCNARAPIILALSKRVNFFLAMVFLLFFGEIKIFLVVISNGAAEI